MFKRNLLVLSSLTVLFSSVAFSAPILDHEKQIFFYDTKSINNQITDAECQKIMRPMRIQIQLENTDIKKIAVTDQPEGVTYTDYQAVQRMHLSMDQVLAKSIATQSFQLHGKTVSTIYRTFSVILQNGVGDSRGFWDTNYCAGAFIGVRTNTNAIAKT